MPIQACIVIGEYGATIANQPNLKEASIWKMHVVFPQP